MLVRVIRAALLDGRVYTETDEESKTMFVAFGVVVAVGVAFALGIRGMSIEGFEDASAMLLLVAVSTMIVAWGMWGAVAWLVGAKLLRGDASYRRLLRALGLASGPGILLALWPIPEVGPTLVIVARIWMLASGTVAVREALGFGTVKASIPAALGWFAGQLFLPAFLLPVQ